MEADPWIRRTILGLVTALSIQGCGDGSAPTSAPSILLVTLDTTRADALGCDQGVSGLTPHLDQLAEESVYFEQARTVAPLTLPSHSSMLTGLYPFEHGVRDNGSFQLGEDETTLAELLTDAGYRCGAFVAAPVLGRGYGLAQGFERYDDPLRGNFDQGMDAYRPATEVTDAALEWLNAGDGPCFLWVHYFDPHHPRHPPEQHLVGTPVTDVITEQRRLYAGEVRYADAEFGRLRNAFEHKAAQRRADTVIAVLADHGEGLGDHKEFTHGYFLYDTTMRVPFLLKAPGVVEGSRISNTVSVVDAYATLLATAGIEPGPSSAVDLLPVARGETSADLDEDRLLYFETCMPYVSHRWSPWFGIVWRGRKYVVDSGGELMYDYAADANEQSDLTTQVPDEVMDAFRERLRSLQARTADLSRRALPSGEMEALQALGYIGGATSEADGAALLPGAVDPTRRSSRDSRELIRLQNGAVAEAGARRFRTAATMIEEALEQDPDNPALLEVAGLYWTRANVLERAQGHLEKATELHPDGPTVWERLADVHRLRGRRREAREAYRRSLVADPDNLQVRLQLAQLLEGNPSLDEERRVLLQGTLERLPDDDPRLETVRDALGQLDPSPLHGGESDADTIPSPRK